MKGNWIYGWISGTSGVSCLPSSDDSRESRPTPWYQHLMVFDWSEDPNTPSSCPEIRVSVSRSETWYLLKTLEIKQLNRLSEMTVLTPMLVRIYRIQISSFFDSLYENYGFLGSPR